MSIPSGRRAANLNEDLRQPEIDATSENNMGNKDKRKEKKKPKKPKVPKNPKPDTDPK